MNEELIWMAVFYRKHNNLRACTSNCCWKPVMLCEGTILSSLPMMILMLAAATSVSPHVINSASAL